MSIYVILSIEKPDAKASGFSIVDPTRFELAASSVQVRRSTK